MAGLTAALRLAERNFDVTVYERNAYIGGLLSAHTHGDGAYHEHSYHMFLTWYHNFWQLVEDIGLRRESAFEPRELVRYVGRREPGGEARSPRPLYHPGLPERLIDDMFSGIVPPADMFLAAYSLIDLLTQKFEPDRLIDQYSVNSFMQSRPYASEQSARVHEYALAKAFAVPSYLTSASSYQSFVKFWMRTPTPMLWVLKGDVERALLRPLADRLVALGCKLRLGCPVAEVAPLFDLYDDGAQLTHEAYVHLRLGESEDRAGRRVNECFVAKGAERYRSGNPRYLVQPPPIAPPGWVYADSEPRVHDYVVLAVPYPALQHLIAPDSFTRAPDSTSGGGPQVAPPDTEGPRVRLPRRHRGSPSRVRVPGRARRALRLPRVLKLKSESMAALDLYFHRRLPGIPREHVVLMDSDYGLTFIDNSLAWSDETVTVLNVMASDFKAIANLEAIDAVNAILGELVEYIDFDEGDIDWDRLHFQTNVGDELFINEVGSEAYRPGPTATGFPQLFVAGDFCKTTIDVVTVEAAVASGLNAVRALQWQATLDGWIDGSSPMARPVAVARPESYPEEALAFLKTALAAPAAAAKVWSWVGEQLESERGYGKTFDALGQLMLAPYGAATWWKVGLEAFARMAAGRPSSVR